MHKQEKNAIHPESYAKNDRTASANRAYFVLREKRDCWTQIRPLVQIFANVCVCRLIFSLLSKLVGPSCLCRFAFAKCNTLIRATKDARAHSRRNFHDIGL